MLSRRYGSLKTNMVGPSVLYVTFVLIIPISTISESKTVCFIFLDLNAFTNLILY